MKSKQLIIALVLVLSLALWPATVDAVAKKGKLTKVVEITRHDFVDIDTDQPSVHIDGFDTTIVLDHEATVLVHGVLVVSNDSGQFAPTVVVDDVPDPDPLVFVSGAIPILHSITLAPGTHSLSVVVFGVNGHPVPLGFGYRDRRLVILVF